jgi:hypothetical protein
MAEKTQVRAETEPWWAEFVSLYKTVPLRELARRFGTNSRRLRRAVQRSALDEEPEKVRESEQRLGTLPDASLADDLDVTVEHIQGARLRRGVAPFNPRAPRRTKPVTIQRPAPPPSDKPKRVRADPNQVQVVVRRAPVVERRGDLLMGVSLSRSLAVRPPPPPGPAPAPFDPPPPVAPPPPSAAAADGRRRVVRRPGEVEVTRRTASEVTPRRRPSPLDDRDDPEQGGYDRYEDDYELDDRPVSRMRSTAPAGAKVESAAAAAEPDRGRRRIVSSDRAPAPEPPPEEEAPKPMLRRKPRDKKVAAPVRTVFEKARGDALPEHIKLDELLVERPRRTTLEPLVEAPRPAARVVEEPVAAPVVELVPVVEAPVAAPPPVVVNNGAPVKSVPVKSVPVNGASSFWLVTFSTGRELVVAASSVLVAAQLGAAQGEVRAVGPLPSL